MTHAAVFPGPTARPAVTRSSRESTAGDDDQAARWSSLMARAQDGDGLAYEMLLRECLPWLRRICGARLRDPAEAEDAVQDALVTLHMIRHTYDPTRPFRPWLAAIAGRRAIDRARSGSRRARHEAAFAADVSLRATGPHDPDFLAVNRLHAALADLPPAQKLALELTKLEDLALTEASRRSGMTVGALKVATHRAFRALRLRLGGASRS